MPIADPMPKSPFRMLWVLIRLAQQDQFDSYRESTIGAAFLTQTISLDENTTVKFEIWDTAGQERYKSLAPMYYRNANCAVVVYDITQSVCNPSHKTHACGVGGDIGGTQAWT